MVRFLGTTPGGATIEAGPFVHINVTTSHVSGSKIDTAGLVRIASRDRNVWLFEDKLPLEEFDVIAEEGGTLPPEETEPEPEPKPKRKYKKRKKREETEPAESEPASTEPLTATEAEEELEAE